MNRYLQKRKNFISALCILLCVVLFFGLFSALNHSAPDNPMDREEADASEMYRMSPSLNVDEELLSDIPNANISTESDQTNPPEEQEDLTEAEEPEEEEDQEEEEEQEEPDITPPPQQQPPQEWTNQTVSEVQWVRQQVRTPKPREDSSDRTPSDDPSTPSDSVGEDEDENGVPSLKPQKGGNGTGTPTPTPTPKPTDGPGNEGTPTPSPTDGPGPTSAPDQKNYFNTNIDDGMSVRDPEFDLVVTRTADGMRENLVNQSVTINGRSYGFDSVDNTHITFDEGENTVQVKLVFSGNISQTKTYTVFYVPQGSYFLQVYRRDTDPETVIGDGETVTTYEENFGVRVYAPVGTPVLRLNQDIVELDGNGTSLLTLVIGANTLDASVGSGLNRQTFSCTIVYDPGEFTLTFRDRSGQISDRITPDNVGQEFRHDFAAENTEFAFRVDAVSDTGSGGINEIRVTDRNGTTDVTSQKGADGFITIQLDASNNISSGSAIGTIIEVDYTDSTGASFTGRWRIFFKRSGYTPTDKQPVITFCNLTDGETLTASPFVLQVSGSDYRRNSLYAMGDVPGTDEKQIEVYLNGERLAVAGQGSDRGQNPVFEYYLNAVEGANELRIVMTDNEQYSYPRTLNLYYDASGGQIQVQIRIDADAIGLGPLVMENVTIDAGQTVAEAIEQILAAKGYTPIHTGAGETYYLKGISKPGLLNGWNVSDERIEELTSLGYTFHEPDDLNVLDDNSFTNRCGWMITQNGVLINMTMGTRTIRDGDMLNLYYVLNG